MTTKKKADGEAFGAPEVEKLVESLMPASPDAELLAKVAELEAKLQAQEKELSDAKKGKLRPVESGDIIQFDNGAKYKQVGKCNDCGIDVYKCITHPLRDDGALGNRIAVYVPGARPPKPDPDYVVEPVLYCLRHDPGAEHRKKAVHIKPGTPLPQEYWEPLG